MCNNSTSAVPIAFARIRRVALATLFLFPLTNISAEPTTTDYLGRPVIEAPQLSPSGAYLSYLSSYEDGERTLSVDLYFYDTDHFGLVDYTQFGNHDLLFYRWIADDRVLFHAGNLEERTRPWSETRVLFLNGTNLNVSGKLMARAMPAEYHIDGGALRVIDHRYVFTTQLQRWAPAPRAAVRLGSVGNMIPPQGKSPNLIRLDSRTGRTYTDIHNRINADQWYADSTGDFWAAQTAGDDFTDLIEEVVILRGKKWEPLLTFPTGELHVLGAGESQELVYVAARNGGDKLAFYALDVSTGDLGEPLLTDPDYDVFSKGTGMRHLVLGAKGEPLFYEYMRDKITFRFYDDAFASVQRQLDEIEPGMDNRIIDWSEDYSVFLVQSSSPAIAPVYRLMNQDGEVIYGPIESRPNLPRDGLSDTHAITFETRDELILHGYLTLPDKKFDQPPLLVLVGRYPFLARTDTRFSPLVNFLASHGIAVLRVDHRGSGGYGHATETAGYGQLGLGMQDDLVDAVEYVGRSYAVDTDKVCLMGSNYGGYATVAGLARSSDVYACGVYLYGFMDLSNWRNLGLWPDQPLFAKRRQAQVELMLGLNDSTSLPKEVMDAVNVVNQISAPLMMIYNKDNIQVGRGFDSQSLYQTSKKYDVPFTRVLLDKKDPDVVHEVQLMSMYNEVLRFLGENLDVPIDVPDTPNDGLIVERNAN